MILLTEPWQGRLDLVGMALALGSGVCWGLYIVLTQRAGDTVTGLSALAISMPVAALIATIVVRPCAVGHLTRRLMVIGLGIALLLPVIPFSLELLALRRLSTATFGTLMSLEPAVALIIGLLALSQIPQPSAVLGILFVITASVGAERSGARTDITG